MYDMLKEKQISDKFHEVGRQTKDYLGKAMLLSTGAIQEMDSLKTRPGKRCIKSAQIST